MVQKKKSGLEKARKRLMRLALRQTHLYRQLFMVRPTGFEPAAYRVGVIKPSSWKPCGARAWLRLHKFPAIYEKTSEPLWRKGSGGFRDSSQIVVWIKCGFSSPVQLNIFTLYPWIRSAASHPSTLARSSTIPACAFASSYCFCS